MLQSDCDACAGWHYEEPLDTFWNTADSCANAFTDCLSAWTSVTPYGGLSSYRRTNMTNTAPASSNFTAKRTPIRENHKVPPLQLRSTATASQASHQSYLDKNTTPLSAVSNENGEQTSAFDRMLALTHRIATKHSIYHQRSPEVKLNVKNVDILQPISVDVLLASLASQPTVVKKPVRKWCPANSDHEHLQIERINSNWLPHVSVQQLLGSHRSSSPLTARNDGEMRVDANAIATGKMRSATSSNATIRDFVMTPLVGRSLKSGDRGLFRGPQSRKHYTKA